MVGWCWRWGGDGGGVVLVVGWCSSKSRKMGGALKNNFHVNI